MAERVAAGGGVDLAGLLQLFGGTKSDTKSSADTAALQQLLGQLQGQDYSQMLQSIFTQASTQIPGFQAAFSNAVGARSGNNSGVANALQQLLASTTLRAQGQIAQQQQNNQQLQLGVGQAIAGATRRQTTQQGTNLGRAGGSLLALQLLSQLGRSQFWRNMTGSGNGQGSMLMMQDLGLSDMSFGPQDYSLGGMDLGGSGSGFSMPDYGNYNQPSFDFSAPVDYGFDGGAVDFGYSDPGVGYDYGSGSGNFWDSFQGFGG